MTKLISCKTCSREVSANAATCPHCGETLKKKLTAPGWVAALIIALLVGGILYYLYYLIT